MKNKFIYFTAILFAFGCTNQKEELITEVMLIHDEVMPKMGEIATLKSELESEINSLNLDSLIDTAMVQKCQVTLIKLDEVDKSMMDWMHEFEPNFEAETEEEIIRYYATEKQKITAVSDHMKSAIDEAKTLMKE